MKKDITVALLGNPNAGKTTLFNALTGSRQHVGNWPGVTVEKKEGALKHAERNIHVVDLPGAYSLTAFSLEEIIARNYIVDCLPDVVINVVDASNLERNLYLSVQLMEMGVKMVIALNMIDVAQGRNILVDIKTLGEIFRAPVAPTNGKKHVGIQELLDSVVDTAEAPDVHKPRPIQYGVEIEEELGKVERELKKSSFPGERLSAHWTALKLLEGDPDIITRFNGAAGGLSQQLEKSRTHLSSIFGDPPDILLADARYGFVSGAIRQAVRVAPGDRAHISDNLDHALTHQILGPIILGLVLYVVYLFTFQGSEPLVKLCADAFSWLASVVSGLLSEGLLKSLLVSGVINGVGSVLSFTPLIAFMFFAIAVLEDTGYMARIAFMLDRVLRGFGLHGASMLALMVSGGLAGGCAVPGIMATRTMKEPKERLVTILVAPLMNCGAKLPVYALLIGAFFPYGQAKMMFLLTIISWAMALLAAKLIRATLLSGPSAPFVLELPPYRMPTMHGLLTHTWERTWMYVKKAGTLILSISVVVWAVMSFPDLPAERSREFDRRIDAVTDVLLSQPAVSGVFHTREDLERFERLRTQSLGEQAQESPAIQALLTSRSTKEPIATQYSGLAEAYTNYIAQIGEIEGERQSAKLKGTIGGSIGVALEYVFAPLGFDWRTNVALVGGFAAKEVVVTTLGTAYSLGASKRGETTALGERLKHEPGWNALNAFTLILFVMMYNPCLATLAVIKRESGKWRWMFFAMLYTTTLAYAVALIVRTIGLLFHLGV